MKISELRAGQGNINVEGSISEIGETRAFTKFGRELKVANSLLKDDSGSIKLTLWNDDITRFKEGDKVRIINGFVSEFQGEKQLTSGKFGRMEKFVGGEEKEETQEKEDEEEKTEKKAKVSKEDVEELEESKDIDEDEEC